MPDTFNQNGYGQNPYAYQGAPNQGMYGAGQQEGYVPDMSNMQSASDIYAQQAAQQYGYDPQAQFAQGQYPNQFQQGYPQMPQESDAQRMARYSRIRSSSVYGPKELHSPKIAQLQQQGQAFAGSPLGGSAAGQQASKKASGKKAASKSKKKSKKRSSSGSAGARARAGASYDPELANAKGTSCLIFGILSIIFGLIPPIGAILGIVGRKKARRYIRAGNNSGKVESGRIFSIVGIVFSCIMFVCIVGFVCFLVGAIIGTDGATSLILFFNQSPLGQIFPIPIGGNGLLYVSGLNA